MRQFLTVLVIAAVVIAKVSAKASDCIGDCSSTHIPYLPHKRCNQFCMCVHGSLESPFELFCPEGLHFSPCDFVCLNPEDANCQEFAPKIKDTGCLGTCPNEDLRQISLFAHQDSHKYCQCLQGEAIVKECPNDFIFNIEFALCMDPQLDD